MKDEQAQAVETWEACFSLQSFCLRPDTKRIVINYLTFALRCIILHLTCEEKENSSLNIRDFLNIWYILFYYYSDIISCHTVWYYKLPFKSPPPSPTVHCTLYRLQSLRKVGGGEGGIESSHPNTGGYFAANRVARVFELYVYHSKMPVFRGFIGFSLEA